MQTIRITIITSASPANVEITERRPEGQDVKEKLGNLLKQVQPEKPIKTGEKKCGTNK